MKFQLMHPRSDFIGTYASLAAKNPLILTEQCFGVIGTYQTRILVLCHDAPAVAKQHGLILWDDDRFVLPYTQDCIVVNEQIYSDWEVME